MINIIFFSNTSQYSINRNDEVSRFTKKSAYEIRTTFKGRQKVGDDILWRCAFRRLGLLEKSGTTRLRTFEIFPPEMDDSLVSSEIVKLF